MDSAITRAEHEEFVKRMDEANDRLSKRLAIVEEDKKSLTGLTVSVEKMAVSLESMVIEQKSQSERLEKLEGRDGETWKMVRNCLITGAITLILGYLAAHLR